MGHYIRVSELPPVLVSTLEKVGYHRKDIEVNVSPSFWTAPPSAQGRKGFVALCRLDTGESKVEWGSWGGSNMFTKTIDDVHETVEIPPHVVFIKGLSNAGTGYPGHATLYVGPNSVNQTLLTAGPTLSEKEQKILAIFKSLKSGYRKEYLSRANVTEEEIKSLISRGFLNQNKAGAISITTEGRNAAGKEYY